MTDVRRVAGSLAGLLGVTTRAFAGIVLILTAAGIVLAAASYSVLAGHPAYAALAAVAALAEAVAAGIALGSRRGLVLALDHGIRALGLGRATVRLVFDRLPADRLPLAEAEERLTRAVTGLVAAPPEGGGPGGWLRRRLRDALLRRVQTYTLARFRRDAPGGGVDLAKIRADLEGRIDDLLLIRLRTGLRLWTAAVVVGLPAVVAAQTYLLLAATGR